jgi:hypothetical protein
MIEREQRAEGNADRLAKRQGPHQETYLVIPGRNDERNIISGDCVLEFLVAAVKDLSQGFRVEFCPVLRRQDSSLNFGNSSGISLSRGSMSECSRASRFSTFV